MCVCVCVVAPKEVNNNFMMISHFYSVRLVLNGVILVVTAGKLKFWILPNLDNEKAGFFESFKPFYSAEWVKEKKKSKKSSLTDKTDTSINITENPENELNSEIQSKLKENEVNEETSLAKETCS